ncbi:hypothetical protein [Streptomyces sp. SID3343]|uniref:hypothetical protein n=1 Tax=Streptomyces sp. SID3343 TaxID=2690260 RepID=UPI00136F2326|nr:hypothetical protein [Streptomyces sp. SID3343]MYW04932.1 hypothetical protein [Streptomyces sp. SID3343]
MKRISTTLTLSLAAALTGMIVAPSSASASATSTGGATNIVFSCTEAGSPQVPLTYAVSIKAPRKARLGTSIPLTVTATKPAPADIPALGIDGDMQIVLGGAASGEVTATGLVNATNVPIGQPLVLGPGSASVPATTPGFHTFTPGAFVMQLWVGATLECTPPASAPALAGTYVY